MGYSLSTITHTHTYQAVFETPNAADQDFSVLKVRGTKKVLLLFDRDILTREKETTEIEIIQLTYSQLTPNSSVQVVCDWRWENHLRRMI